MKFIVFFFAEEEGYTTETENENSVQFRIGGCEDCEPEAPDSFPLPESNVIEMTTNFQPRLLTRSLSATEERNRGSQDSGFFGFETLSSRRRPAPEDVEFGFAFYLKRSRQDHS